MRKISTILFILLVYSLPVVAQDFKILPLGVHGGLEENNLSSYLVAPRNSDNYIAMDAGTLHSGMRKAANKYFNKNASDAIRENISAYFISHPHLDHLAGLIQNAPVDNHKTIYGLPFTIEAISKHYFSWDTWANFGDKGETPQLKKYHLQEMEIGQPVLDSLSGLTITAFPLSHANPGKSSAFLIKNNDGNYLLYLGDTGADTIEHHSNLRTLWQQVGHLLSNHTLKGIMIEVSYPNKQPDTALFGHLKPELLNNELKVLASYSNATALYNFSIIVVHIKPDGNNETIIKQELKKENPFHVKWIFPEQGKVIEL
ncbi:MAG: 3',5'-cyclic-nucleotide phosphodiesterase [Chitinophagaceae bacterium]